MIEQSKKEAVEMMNHLGAHHIPFLFIVDFLMETPMVIPLEEIDAQEVLFDICGINNAPSLKCSFNHPSLSKFPISYHRYITAYEQITRNIHDGNSYLLNLTFPTRVITPLSLRDIFFFSSAKYKLLLDNRFVVFSPESFVRISDGIISSYPMKGTIDASIPDSHNIILNDEKELAEHTTIVDLIRNDLSMVASNVQVDSFRYIERISTNSKDLLQVSSKISGNLPPDYLAHLGSILFTLLPAGSISGAPKKKTVEIILESEQYDRGYYTGVFGCFDGKSVDSGVMIRFIENINGELFYKSGGGITSMSKPEQEYQEMIDKVYVPIL